MWQDIIALSIVALTVVLFVVGSVRNRRRNRVSSCSNCDLKNRRAPAAAPSYIVPMESLAAFAPGKREPRAS